MSDDLEGKGWRIPSYLRPPVTPINPDADFNPESAGLLGYVNGLASKRDDGDDAVMDREDVEMLFRHHMQMARYLAKKYGFKIKQWPPS